MNDGITSTERHGTIGVAQSERDPLELSSARAVLRADGQADVYMVLAFWVGTGGVARGWGVHTFVASQPGFRSCDPCWQQYGLHGCLDGEQAMACFDECRRVHPEQEWLLAHVQVVQKTTAILASCAAVPPPKFAAK